MAQLRDIRRRIKSIKKTQQVTKAMKMVAASKLRRAQDAIVHARPYAIKLRELISYLVNAGDLPEHPFFQKRDNPVLHILVLSGEKGLCGGFNANIFRHVESLIRKYSGPVEMSVVGKKGIEYFKRRKYNMINTYLTGDFDSHEQFANVLSSDLTKRFLSEKCGKIVISYSEFVSAIAQNPVSEWLLPLQFDALEESQYNLDYIFHPNAQFILNELLPKFIYSQVYRSLLESQASEFGARMTAMDSATRNSQDMIAKLTLQYNRARQASITTELIEIVSGAEALKG